MIWRASLARLERKSTLEESLEHPTAHRVLELANGLRFDLAHALASHLEDPSHFLKRVRVAVTNAVTQLDDFALPERECVQDARDLVLEHLLSRSRDR